MKYISKEDYANLHNDYKGIWSSDNIYETNHNGKKTMLGSYNEGSVLLIEGKHFEIVEVIDEEHEVDCEICYGTGATEHDVSCYSDTSPQSEHRECEECSGSGNIMIDYEKI